MAAKLTVNDIPTIATFRMTQGSKLKLREYSKRSNVSQSELLRRFIAALPAGNARKITKVSVTVV